MRGRGSSDSRGWRGRENKENEKNLQEEGGREQGPPRRGGSGRMMNGPGRSGRGGRGGRSGPRTFQSREKGGGPGFPRAIDTWNPQGDAEPADAPTNGPDNGGENWGDFPSPEDWDNEEYTGSLADTKVFTPSANVSSQPGVSQVAVAQSGLEARHDAPIADLATAASVLPSVPVGSGSLDAAASMLPAALTATGMTAAQSAQASKSLTPAQTQYFASLGTENLKAIVGAGAGSGTTNGTKEASSYLSVVNSGVYQSNNATTYQSTPAYTATTVSYSTSTYGTPVASSTTPSYSSQIKGNTSSSPQQQTQQQQLQQAQQPQQSLQSQARPKTQRTRLPPPSKIPSSAVEMPGDTTSTGSSFIDVQFGVDFGTDANSFEFSSNNTAASDVSGKFQSAASVGGLESSHVGPSSVGVQLDLSSMSLKGPSSQQQQTQGQQQQQVAMHQQQSAAQVLDGYSTSSSSQSSSVTAGQPLNASVQHVQHSKDLSLQTNSLSSISHSQKLSGTDSMTFPKQVPEHKPSQAAVTTSYTQGRSGGGVSNTSSTPLDLVKSESSSTASLSYPNSSNSSNNPSSYQSSYQKPSSVYQSSTNYSSSAVSSGTGGSTGYSQGGGSSAGSQYQANQQSQNSGYSSSQSGYSGQATAFPSSAGQPPSTSYSQTSGNTNSSSSSYHQTQGTSGYQSTSYPSMSQPSSSSSAYQSSQQYQSAQQQSYSASSGSTNYNTATGNSAASQYQNSYGSNGPVTTATALHGASSASSKLGSGMGSTNKDSQYDVPSPAGGSSSLGTGSAQGGSSVTPSSLGLVSSSGQVTSNAASTKVTSSTAGVPPAMLGQHQYIMGQQGMPFYNVQQPIYGFDDYQHQLMQSRVPMQTASGFYDMSTLAAGRESGMTSVAYSVSDARFARTDNNSSPVPSTLSQQNPSQAHQQPMLNQTLPPGYAYFYGTGVVPGSFQYGTPALYQLPTATNAHGATNNAQYAKPATYSSGYGSGYDSLSGQGTADYSKASGGYVSAGSQGGQTSKGSVVGSAGSSSSVAASASDLTSNMYGKTHVTLGKVNSYDKQGFHSGTPPPFSLPASQTSQMGAATGYTPLFIPTLAPHQQLHQPLHQDSSSGSGQRSQPTSQQSKTGVKQAYNTSYWAQN